MSWPHGGEQQPAQRRHPGDAVMKQGQTTMAGSSSYRPTPNGKRYELGGSM
jgi:hypothetical protein